MKSILVSAALTALCYTTAIAQCGKKNLITSSKTEFLNADKVLEKVKEEKAEVFFDQKSVTILINGEDENKMTGTISSFECNWAVPYKEGKIVFKALLFDPHGDEKNATFTIEGKGDEITLLLELEEIHERKVRIKADSFTEKIN